jgi:hypothetical protein
VSNSQDEEINADDPVNAARIQREQRERARRPQKSPPKDPVDVPEEGKPILDKIESRPGHVDYLELVFGCVTMSHSPDARSFPLVSV